MTCPTDTTDTIQSAQMCVLASGSSGNCTVLLFQSSGTRRVALIDAGIGIRRAQCLLRNLGIELHEVRDVLLTHLDHDHWRPTWLRARDFSASVWMHESHLDRCTRETRRDPRVRGFRHTFPIGKHTQVHSILMDHDDEGVSVFRIETPSASVGFATDLGRVTQGMITHLQSVDMLAIESNYCPRLQLDSGRPGFLIGRIMGGRGHLSNQEALRAVEAISPREHAVFLHLSRQCNRPERVAELHAGAEYTVTISTQDEPTRWIRATHRHRPKPTPPPQIPVGLWGQSIAGV